MRREVLILFVLSTVGLVGCMFAASFFFDLPISAEVIHVIILTILIGANFSYLFYILYKMSEGAAIAFTVIYGLLFWLSPKLLDRLFPDIDLRLVGLYGLGVMLATTGVVHFVRRRKGLDPPP